MTPDGRMAYVSSTEGITAMLDVVDLPANRVTYTTAQFGPWQSAFLALSSVPLPPVALTAVVTGSLVRLDWALPPASDGASAFVVEAGVAPGRNDVSFRVDGSARSFEVPAVPRGRYFVRLRAENLNGLGPPGAEVVLDVP